ncbi:putative guanylate kinase [Blumeria hordei DH14]|uniref:Guanylate kinase n=1 Tax=Blumeria graminis f. sp. hordei (strain DH14) TaxID=546991 RepID=N1JIX0_BLUG1|nr:putative guanylate kinase [Blumeria hordei DH14]
MLFRTLSGTRYRSLKASGLKSLSIGLKMASESSQASKSIDPRPVIISGPSGVGKGTLYHLLLSRHPSTFATTVSHTTRAPRSGEREGIDYYYISRPEFEDLITRKTFVEHAEYGGNRYGTSKATIQDVINSHRVPVLDIEMEGVKQIKDSEIDARYVFISPPSLELLEQRLRGRGSEKEDSIQKRLAQAKYELEYAAIDGTYDTIIVNDVLEKAYEELEAFILQ